MATPDLPEALWEMWRAAFRKYKCKLFILELASGKYRSVHQACTALNIKSMQHYDWVKTVPHLQDMEKKLMQEPEFAARFLATLYYPYAIHFQGEILTGRVPGNRDQAARFIMHTADPHLRPDYRPIGPAGPPPKEPISRIREIMKGLNEADIDTFDNIALPPDPDDE